MLKSDWSIQIHMGVLIQFFYRLKTSIYGDCRLTLFSIDVSNVYIRHFLPVYHLSSATPRCSDAGDLLFVAGCMLCSNVKSVVLIGFCLMILTS